MGQSDRRGEGKATRPPGGLFALTGTALEVLVRAAVPLAVVGAILYRRGRPRRRRR